MQQLSNMFKSYQKMTRGQKILKAFAMFKAFKSFRARAQSSSTTLLELLSFVLKDVRFASGTSAKELDSKRASFSTKLSSSSSVVELD